ncbi:MAG: ribosomal-protein-alanine N-acetyltransferase [Bdellovibrionales bacterium GWB1_55_8]|nr:MAG: ribosomal-protein-alanine N-acetyltransferase [Bdellovibrionales bacterium GWB1_55_8]
MSQPIFSIRPATDEDISEIVKIENAVHLAPWTAEHVKAELEKPYSHVWIMTDDETDSKLAGYIVFWLFMGECQILNVAVDLPYRGLGYAKHMIRQAANLTAREGIQKITLEVRKSNQAAIALYQGMNFVITQIRKSFYSNGEDAYFMTLSLKDDELRF